MAKLFAILATAASLGGMLFFAAGVAPLVFARLPAPPAGGFIRQLFPVYYLVMAGCTALAAVLSTAIAPADALTLAAVSVTFLFARLLMLPRIQEAPESAAHGDPAAAKPFRPLHRPRPLVHAHQPVRLNPG